MKRPIVASEVKFSFIQNGLHQNLEAGSVLLKQIRRRLSIAGLSESCIRK